MEQPSKCILWHGAKAGNGYGVTSVNGKQHYVHRLAAAERYGPIPPKMVVAHKCDTPNCYNPDHLFVTTQRENMRDMVNKKRSATGEKHWTHKHPDKVLRGEKVGGSKLTAETVQAIRAMYQPAKPGKRSPTSLTGIAKQFNIAFQTVHKIVKGKVWNHL